MSCHHHDLGSTSDRSCREKYFLQPITNIRWLVGTKHVPESKNTFQSPKRVPESKTLRSENPKALVITQNTSPKPKTLLDSGKCFGFGDMFLDSGKCFGFWTVFLDSGTCFGFCEVFFFILGRVMDSGKCFVPIRHGTNTTQIKAVTRVTVMICIPL